MEFLEAILSILNQDGLLTFEEVGAVLSKYGEEREE